ncbi:MAG: MFS transporter [Chloroflexota bacterium]
MKSGFAASPQAAVLRNPRFLKLFTGQIISLLGDSVAYMGLSFLILYRLGGSALDVGKLMIAATIPTLVLGPIAGVFVDRWSRRRVMIVADVVRALIYAAMPLVSSLNLVYAGVFCASVMSRFFYPAKSAIIPNLVEPDQLMVASGLNQTSGSIVAILGPAVGGALAGTLGPGIALYANAASFLLSAILIAAIRLDETHAGAATNQAAADQTASARGGVGAIWRQLLQGFRFIAGNRAARFYTGMFALFMLCVGGVNVLFPPFAKDVLGMDIRMIGIADSAQAVGGLAGGIIVTVIATRFRPARMIFTSVVGTGIVLAAFGLNRSIPAAYALTAATGVLLSAVNIPFSGEMMRLIPNDLRGRVWAAFGSAVDGCSLISMGVMPAIAVAAGLPPVIVAMGLAVAGLGLIALALSGRVMAGSAASPAGATPAA